MDDWAAIDGKLTIGLAENVVPWRVAVEGDPHWIVEVALKWEFQDTPGLHDAVRAVFCADRRLEARQRKRAGQ